jgi:hypothetical protein
MARSVVRLRPASKAASGHAAESSDEPAVEGKYAAALLGRETYEAE